VIVATAPSSVQPIFTGSSAMTSAVASDSTGTANVT
jgi:hypothetical protein